MLGIGEAPRRSSSDPKPEVRLKSREMSVGRVIARRENEFHRGRTFPLSTSFFRVDVNPVFQTEKMILVSDDGNGRNVGERIENLSVGSSGEKSAAHSVVQNMTANWADWKSEGRAALVENVIGKDIGVRVDVRGNESIFNGDCPEGCRGKNAYCASIENS